MPSHTLTFGHPAAYYNDQYGQSQTGGTSNYSQLATGNTNSMNQLHPSHQLQTYSINNPDKHSAIMYLS